MQVTYCDIHPKETEKAKYRLELPTSGHVDVCEEHILPKVLKELVFSHQTIIITKL